MYWINQNQLKHYGLNTDLITVITETGTGSKPVTWDLGHCHTVTLSHCHTVTLSHCHTVTLHTVTPSHCHTVTLSHCHTVTLSHCHTLRLSHSHTFTFRFCTNSDKNWIKLFSLKHNILETETLNSIISSDCRLFHYRERTPVGGGRWEMGGGRGRQYWRRWL